MCLVSIVSGDTVVLHNIIYSNGSVLSLRSVRVYVYTARIRCTSLLYCTVRGASSEGRGPSHCKTFVFFFGFCFLFPSFFLSRFNNSPERIFFRFNYRLRRRRPSGTRHKHTRQRRRKTVSLNPETVVSRALCAHTKRERPSRPPTTIYNTVYVCVCVCAARTPAIAARG